MVKPLVQMWFNKSENVIPLPLGTNPSMNSNYIKINLRSLAASSQAIYLQCAQLREQIKFLLNQQ